MVIGFVGLGIMGKPMAKNLLRSGEHSLRIYARRPAVIEEMRPLGALPVSEPASLGEGCDAVCTMLPDGPDVEKVVLGAGGVAEGMTAGSTLIDFSSINPDVSRRIAGILRERGIRMMDAPVTGGEKGAIDGTLTIMAGGEKEVYDRFLPLLRTMGKNVVFCGPVGSGNTVKLVNQVIVADTIAAISEGYLLAEKAGISPELVYSVLRNGTSRSHTMDDKLPKMVQKNFTPGFKLGLQEKDVRNAIDFGRQEGVPMPVTELVRREMAELCGAGYADKDSSSLVAYYLKKMEEVSS